MSECYEASEECFGEVRVYQYRVGTKEEIAEEDAAPGYKRGINFLCSLCEFHKRGELYVQKPMHRCLPYQGIARRALLKDEK